MKNAIGRILAIMLAFIVAILPVQAYAEECTQIQESVTESCCDEPCADICEEIPCSDESCIVETCAEEICETCAGEECTELNNTEATYETVSGLQDTEMQYETASEEVPEITVQDQENETASGSQNAEMLYETVSEEVPETTGQSDPESGVETYQETEMSCKDPEECGEMPAATGLLQGITDTDTENDRQEVSGEDLSVDTQEISCEHVLTVVPAEEATCEKTGNTEYYKCSECGKCFKDAAGTEEAEEDSFTVKAKGHGSTVQTKENVKASTASAKGSYVLVTSCSVCGKELSRKTVKTEALGYAVTYYLNGGTNDSRNVSRISHNNKKTALYEPTREGYTFAGWYADKNCTGTKITAIPKKYNKEVKLYAKWTVNTYKIKYNLNGGTNNSKNVATRKYGKAVTLYNPTKTGYTFGGWYTNKNCTGTAVTKIAKTYAKNVTLYAKWTVNTYKITYNLNGGTNNSKNAASKTYGKAVKLYSPTKTGYTFAGWYADKKCMGTSYTKISKNYNKKVTLYAKWTANTYTIKFKANGGTGTMASKTMTYDTAATLTKNAFTRSGYTFAGWSTSKNGSAEYKNKASVINLSSENKGSVTLYAVWTPDEDEDSIEASIEWTSSGEDGCKHEAGMMGYIEPTCADQGCYLYCCTDCGKIFEYYVTDEPLTEHFYNLIDDKRATYYEDGYIKYICWFCGDVHTEVYPAICKLPDWQVIYK